MKKNIIFQTILLILFSACNGFCAHAQSYVVKRLDVREGLSNNHVVSIAQDKRGFLWFATEEGLNLFDGLRFTPYYRKENPARPWVTGNELNCVFDDPQDSILWIGTQRAGLNAYHYTDGTFSNYLHSEDDPASLATDDVTDITASGDGNLWICTYWRGVDYFDKKKGTFTHYSTENVAGFVNDQVWCAVESKNGDLFIGHVRHGLSILSVKERKAKNFLADPDDPHSLPGNEIACIYRDPNGNVWIGTDNGLALYNPEDENFIRFDDAEKNLSYRVHDIQQMDDNTLWIAMEFGGIAILDLSQHLFHTDKTPQFTFLREGDDEFGLSRSTIRCLKQDSFGNIWAGSWGGGINFIVQEPPLFSVYKYSPFYSTNDKNLTDKTVSSACFDRKGNLWIGTDKGEINVFSGDRRIADYHVFPRRPHSVQAALCDSRGNLWFGVFSGGILFYNVRTRTFRQILPPQLADIDVRSFYEDKNGMIWTATSGGMLVIDRDEHTVKKRFGSTNDLVRCILQDPMGRVWVGFFGDGLKVYDEQYNEIALFDVKSRFPSNTLNDLYIDSRQQLWAATGDGLVCFPSLQSWEYQVYRRENGLNNTHIQAIEEDTAGNLWFSTNRGIGCYLHDKQVFYNYERRDNMPAGSFCRECAVRGKDGKLYFGALNGLCYFDPEAVLQERESPPAFINHIEIYGPMENDADQPSVLSLNGRQSIWLDADQNSFSIAFNVQNYALAGDVEYAYMLKGLKDSWYTVATNNVTFRNLNPGTYQFQVKTRMHNQEWSDEIASIDIHIAPSLWQTWWANLLYLLAFLTVLFFIFYVYKKRLDAETLYKLEKQNHEHEQELNNERLRFYTNITHELRTPLTLIVGPLEDLQKSDTLSAKDAQKIAVIHQSAIRLLNLINQILEFRKTETQNKKLCVSRGNIVSVVHEIGLRYKELNQKGNVEIRLELPPSDIVLYFDVEVVRTVLENLLSNAIKYTEQGSITIGIRQTERAGVRYTDLYVSDTGYGIRPEALPHIFERYYQEGGKHQASGTGIGLSLVKNLVELHEGEISVESAPNAGSTFCVSLLTDNYYPNVLHADSADGLAESGLGNEREVADSNFPILLIVEDNADIRNYIADSFCDTFEVHAAANGKEGMECALKEIPDIIVSDIMMPGMDGNEMCRELKKDVRTSHIPIILLTAKDSIQDKEEGYAVGADSYLTKPFSANLLRSRIENLLQSRRKLVEHFSLKGKGVQHEKSAAALETLNKIDDEFLQKINKLIEARLSSDKVDIGYLSDKMCMSGSTLYRKMKALTGLSTTEYVRKVKMQFAEKLLLEGKHNISEIAFRVGMNNLYYFRQCFKDEFGAIPSEYIRKLKNEEGEENEGKGEEESES